MIEKNEASEAAGAPAPRQAWVSPELTVLPRLTELTLQTFGPSIEGSGGESGSTVIP